MAANPRRTLMTRPEGLSLKTNMILRKGATFHSPTTPPSSPDADIVAFRPPPLPRRSHTNLDDVIDSHRRRVMLTLGNIDKSLASSVDLSPRSKNFRDDSLPIPRGVLHHTLDTSIMAKDAIVERRVLRPRNRPTRHHESDSGLGSSIASSNQKRAEAAQEKERTVTAVTRSVAARSADGALPALSAKATNRIYEHTLKPLLAKPSFKDFHRLVLECPKKIQNKEIVSLRDVEKILLLAAPERTKVAGLYLDFCLTTIRCIQATVEYLSDREQTRPRDLPYTSGYFIDLVEQIRLYAEQLADAKEKGEVSEMDVDPSDEIKLHGGIHINGRPAELVRVKKNGKAISMATGEAVDVVEETTNGPVKFKRSASQELEDEEEIMRSMARRKKNASPEELAPKRCREPGCNKEFKRPCDLTKHEKTHSRPWKCPVPTCKYHEYGWPTEKEMDRHHNDKHSSAPAMYECLYKPCPYKSKRESNCKQHMEKAHGWTYVRTKTNGNKNGVGSVSGSIHQPTPQLQNMPTPSSDHSMGAATPPDDTFGHFYNSNDFPTYHPDAGFGLIPQELKIDYSPADNASPTTDGGIDIRPYQDLAQDFTLYEDIYGAHVQLPTPVHNAYQKEMPQFNAFTAGGLCQPQPAHISPIGEGNIMLCTPPTSLAELDEGYDERQEFISSLSNGHHSPDFVLFPGSELPVSKPMYNDPLFVSEVPSMAAGYSQPNSQDFMTLNNMTNMHWSQEGFHSQGSFQSSGSFHGFVPQ